MSQKIASGGKKDSRQTVKVSTSDTNKSSRVTLLDSGGGTESSEEIDDGAELVRTLLGAAVDDETRALRIAEFKLRVCKKGRVREMEFIFVAKRGAPRSENVLAKCQSNSHRDAFRYALMVVCGIQDIVRKGVVEQSQATKIRMNGKLVQPLDVFRKLGVVK